MGDAIEQIGGVPIGAFLETKTSPTWRELIVEHPEWRIFQANARPVEIMPGQANAGWVLSITEVTQERRRQEQIQAQERLAALGRMAAGIAHDFNNILQGIIGFADIVVKQPGLNELTLRRVERISQEGHRGADLVRQILDFSRQSPPNLQPVAMEALVPYYADLWRGTLPPTVHLVMEIQDMPCLVAADASQLSHVFTNLAVNARRSHATRGHAGRPPANVRPVRRRTGPYCQNACRSLGGAIHRRFRLWHCCQRPAARLRAVLHHQTDRSQRRPGPGTRLRHHSATRRVRVIGQPPERRNDRNRIPTRLRSARPYEAWGVTLRRSDYGKCYCCRR